jgi:HPr kinase/phosphorylase
MADTVTVHGSCVAFGKRAVLIRGAPGSGKSTLALELIETEGTGLSDKLMRAKLVSDDQTMIIANGDMLLVQPVAALKGKLEVRGLGLVDVNDVCEQATLALVVDLDKNAERMPPPDQTTQILGLSVPLLVFQAGGGALAARVRTALNSTVAVPS